MMFLLLILFQSQTRLSWLVIAAAIIALAAGVSLFIYFYKRYKRLEKESEDDWDSSRHSLFVNPNPALSRIDSTEPPAEVVSSDTVVKEQPVLSGGTREFASSVERPTFASDEVAEPEPKTEAAPEEPIPAPTPVSHEAPATELLTSPAPDQPAPDRAAVNTPTTFDDEIWDGLDVAEPAQPVAPPSSVVRVEERPQKQSFEAPRIEHIANRRERFVSPSIEPLTPREAAATRELRSLPSPPEKVSSTDRVEDTASRSTVRFGSIPGEIRRPIESPRAESETRELAGTASRPAAMPEKPLSPAHKPSAHSFGSVLGLPTEASERPLVLGKQVKPADEMGIGALTHYGQDLGPKGGRAGIIVLLSLLALLVGAFGVYYFVPSVHSRVDSFIAQLRGTEAMDRDATKTKAQIIPSSRPEVNKNMVTARGAIDNIADEPLAGLEVEVSLRRGDDAAPEVRRIPVTPDPLQPGERGTFEFEYDGKRDTGFAGYTITKLFSAGTEIRFRTPAQQ